MIAEFLQKRVRIMAHDVCFEGIVRFVDLQSGVLCLDRGMHEARRFGACVVEAHGRPGKKGVTGNGAFLSH